MKRPIKAYSCQPRDEEYHIVVFTTNAPKARLLGSQADPAYNEDYIVSRLPRADGLSRKECVWIDEADAPTDVRERAAALWADEED